jgi:tRNA pseudouridine(55) synthase
MPLILFIKEAGHTMNQTVDIYKKNASINSRVCYCGRLDPMARGLVLLLAGDDCKEMPYYNKCQKEYQFEILFGISTDTDDPLGMITGIEPYNLIDVIRMSTNIKKYINIGEFEQDFHDYSSKRIDGKALWEYKKNNILLEKKPSHLVSIYDVKYDDIKYYNFNDWRDSVISTINKIDKKNDFRQDIIINQYYNLPLPNDQSTYMSNDESNMKCLYALPISIKVSSGFYVRQLVADIKTHFNINILTYDINRLNININY